MLVSLAVFLCVDGQGVIQDSTHSVPVEVEIVVIGDVCRAVSIAGICELHAVSSILESCALCEREVARKSLIQIRTLEGEDYSVSVDFGGEQPLVEALRSVKGVRAVVDGQVIGYAAQGEASVSDSVGVASDSCAEAAGIVEVFVEGVVAESHVTEVAVFVEDVEFGDSAAVFADGGGLSGGVGEGVAEDRSAVWHSAEEGFSDGHGVILLCD